MKIADNKKFRIFFRPKFEDKPLIENNWYLDVRKFSAQEAQDVLDDFKGNEYMVVFEFMRQH